MAVKVKRNLLLNHRIKGTNAVHHDTLLKLTLYYSDNAILERAVSNIRHNSKKIIQKKYEPTVGIILSIKKRY